MATVNKLIHMNQGGIHMKKMIVLLFVGLILTACSPNNGKANLPFDIDLTQVEEIGVYTFNEEGTYELDDGWTKFIEVVMDYSYKSIPMSEVEETWTLLENDEDFYTIMIDCDDDIYNFLIFEDMIIANYIDIHSDESEDAEFYIAKQDEIETLREELSGLELPSKTMRIEKPVIYLYPEEELDISVLIEPEDILTTSYPQYDNGWTINAWPNGDIHDIDGKKYAYLYWEGDIELLNKFEDGFIVNRNDITNFLESKLEILGLNYREKNDFISYWLPSLEEHEYSKIRFYTEEINELVKLKITPEPQTLIRVYMVFEEASGSEQIRKQILEPVKRQGYTVVEWGGAEIPAY